MPFLSPIPRTLVSTCVAPASSAQKAFAIAQPASTCQLIDSLPSKRSQWLTVVVEMCLDVAVDNAPKCSHKVVHLSWRCATDGICNSNSVDANLVNSRVDGEQIYQVRAERVLAGESDLNTLVKY
jgi:hypothetical protein